jgi:hypothetical protein
MRFCCVIAISAPSPALWAPSPQIGEKERGPRFENWDELANDAKANFSSHKLRAPGIAKTRLDRSRDRPEGEQITNIESGALSKRPIRIRTIQNPNDAKDFNCLFGSFLKRGARRFLKSVAYIRVWRGMRAGSKRGQAPLC